jgi:hypothetical protein
MALIRKSNCYNMDNHERGQHAVFEDPRSSSTKIYFFDEAHDKSTYAPIINSYLINQGDYAGASYNYGKHASMSGINHDQPAAGYVNGTISTSKGNIGTQFSIATSSSSTMVRVDFTPYWSMDPANPSSGTKLFQSGSDQMIVECQGGFRRNQWSTAIWSAGALTDINDTTPSSHYQEDGVFGSNSYVDPRVLCYLDNAGLVQGIYSRNTDRDDYLRYPFWKVGFPAGGSPARTEHYLDNAMKQFVGGQNGDTSGGGSYGIYFSCSQNNDYTHRIDKYDASTTTATTLHSFTTAHSGGNRTIPGNMGAAVKISSKHFSVTGGRGWYTPYFDTSDNYIPWYFEWDTSTDTFTRSETTITGNSSTTAGVTGNNTYVNNPYSRTSSVWLNEVCEVSGTKYVTLFPMHADYDINDGTAGYRTFVTYSVSNSDETALTYHSVVTAEKTICNILYLNDARTRLAMLHYDKVVFYNFNSLTGWVKTGEFNKRCNALGLTQDGTLFAAADDQADHHVSLHKLSTAIPLSITVDAADSAYTYSGTTINTNLEISAKNFNDSYVACDITLEIDGSTMKFDSASGPITKSITLSNSGVTTQPISIIGSGNSTVITKLDI